jgi:hypothetical protein
MKYTIEGLQQQALIDLGLDCVDAVILRWVIDFRDTGKMRLIKIGTQEMFWINYGYMLEDIPIISIKNKDVLARRFNRICECGLMNKYVDKGAQGTYTYFNFNPDVLESLFHPMQESNPTRLLSRPPTRLESRTKDTSIKDNPNTNNTHTAPEGQGNEIVEINVEAVGKHGAQDFDTFWEAYGKKVKKPDAERAFRRAIKKTTLDVMLSAIEKHKRTDSWMRGFQPYPATWLNSESWNDDVQVMSHGKPKHTVKNATEMWT